MYMNPVSSPGWWSDFNKKQNSTALEEEKDDGIHSCEEKEMVMGLVLSQRSCLDLMQNCDLPPPLKVFAAADKTALTAMKPTTSTKIGGGKEEGEIPIGGSSMGDEYEKMGLLKALQLSQTRAREAEKKAKLMTQERDRISNSLMEESLKLLAHRQWVKLLELEVSHLKSQRQQKRESGRGSSEDDGGDVGSLAWCMALALCLGFALGCRFHVLNFLSFYPF